MIASLTKPLQRAKEFLFHRRTAYLRVFDNVNGEVVLADLAKFCRANQTCMALTDRETALLEGRREVWLRIQHHLKLNQETLWKLYSGLDDN